MFPRHWSLTSLSEEKKGLFDTNAAFTLNGFDDQERNLAFVKTGL